MMKRFLFFILLLLPAMACFAQGAEIPQGELTHFEFTTTYRDGEFLSQSSTATLQEDGQVRVTCYDYYAKYDSTTVYASKEVLQYIAVILAKEAKWHSMNEDVIYLNGETGYGQTHHFRAVYSCGDVLGMNGYIARYGMRDIQKYLIGVCDSIVRHLPAEELKGPVPADALWHAGSRYGTCSDITERSAQPLKFNRYRMQGWEVLVVRHKKTGALIDIYRRIKHTREYVEEIRDAYISLLSGVYQNETGKSIFGSIQFSREEMMEDGYSGGDPGAELDPEMKVSYEAIVFTDTLYWGKSRIVHRYDMPADAPPGWGGHGAIAGPTKWIIRFTSGGLTCEELESPMHCQTWPAFGKEFVLVKIRGPYEFTRAPWAIVSEEPMVRDLLNRLAPRQLNAMLSEIKVRHKDGSALKPMEKLNRELILSVLAKKKR